MKVPEKCLICGSDWSGGHQVPLKPMKEELRVFYDCGCSMSYRKNKNNEGAYNIYIKNCSNDKGE